MQAQVEQAVAGEAPQIVRNAGGGGARDLHLEDFSVSNGGPDLIENASVIMAFGRRCAPVRRLSEGCRMHRMGLVTSENQHQVLPAEARVHSLCQSFPLPLVWGWEILALGA